MIVDSKGIIKHNGEVVADVYCGVDYSIINIFDIKAIYEMTNHLGYKKNIIYSNDSRIILNTISKRLRRIGGFCVRDLYISNQHIISYYIPSLTPICDWKCLSKMNEFWFQTMFLETKKLYFCRGENFKNPEFYDCVPWRYF